MSKSTYTIIRNDDIARALVDLEQFGDTLNRVTFLRGYLPELEALWSGILGVPADARKVELGRDFQAAHVGPFDIEAAR